jgi:hypothetical protein
LNGQLARVGHRVAQLAFAPARQARLRDDLRAVTAAFAVAASAPKPGA